MSYLINNQQKINDIIFANKNKSYGAYAIRSAYGNTVVKSLSFMLLGFGTLMSVAFYMSNRNNDDPNNMLIGQIREKDSVYTIVVDVKPDKPVPVIPVEPAQPNNSSSSAATSTTIVESATVEANTTQSLTGTGSATNTGEGPLGPVTSTGTGTSTITTTPTVEVEPTFIADSQPEYEGGIKALYEYVGSKLKYPEDAKESGKEGTVYVKFVVDQKGKVGTLSLLNHVGFGLDEEALRVVSMIPNFKTPGMVNGKPVKVYFQLPIKFKMR